jgi:hypothetical protein
MMDGTQFDALSRSLTQSRRSLLGGALALAGGWLGVANTEARNKRKKKGKHRKKPKQLVFNQYGCVDVGQPCRGDSTNCCSGICEGVAPRKGKPDQSRCVAHNASICTPTLNMCSTGSDSTCNAINTNTHCTVTTGNAGFCADFTFGAARHCRECARDTDCQAEFGAGVACVVFTGICSEYCPATGGTACMPAGA